MLFNFLEIIIVVGDGQSKQETETDEQLYSEISHLVFDISSLKFSSQLINEDLSWKINMKYISRMKSSFLYDSDGYKQRASDPHVLNPK